MRTLGAVIAGGAARRFGGDKAAAEIGGVALLEHALAALSACQAIVVVGRAWPGLATVADQPEPGLGPLGGLLGALRHAEAAGFDQVLTSGCDLPGYPPGLLERLAPGPAVIAGQPLLGLWPAALAGTLERHLATAPDRSLYGWIAAAGARQVAVTVPLPNINTRADLARYAETIRRREDLRSSR